MPVWKVKSFSSSCLPWHTDEQDDHRDSYDEREHGCRCQILLVVSIFNLVPEGAHMDLGALLQVDLDNLRLEFVRSRPELRLQLKKVLTLGQILHLEKVREREREDGRDLGRVNSRFNLD